MEQQRKMKIVLTDHRFPDVELIRRAVEDAGGQLVVAQALDERALMEHCKDADGVLTARAPITKRVIEAMKRCRIVVRLGTGVDTIDASAAKERGILLGCVPDYSTEEVANHALMLLLILNRQTMAAMALARNETWSIAAMPPVRRLRGQVCGMFGAGRIGMMLASNVQQLQMKVIVCDPIVNEQRAREIGVERVDFDTLLRRSDFISIHAPLNDSTRHVFNEAAFKKMKNTAFIINTARGGLIDEAALLAAIDSNKIAGAGLDVLESETAITPLRQAIVNHAKVVATPHSAWFSEEARCSLQTRAVEQVVSYLMNNMPAAEAM
jgi:D-3-phosphoglycerate dehydrogenase / 2-oxoglutarate reductase